MEGVGVGDGEAVVVGTGDGVGLGSVVGVGLGPGVAVGSAVGSGVTEGVGVGLAVTVGSTEGETTGDGDPEFSAPPFWLQETSNARDNRTTNKILILFICKTPVSI
jgi:hypothetical protein